MEHNVIPDYITSYASADRPNDVAEALNKAADTGDTYTVVKRTDGRYVIQAFHDGEYEGTL